MSSAMKAYLAEKYMSGPKADAILARTHKKKKRKAGPSSTASTSATSTTPTTSGTIILDEDAGWVEPAQEDDEDIKEALIEKDRAFKKRKVEGEHDEGGGWATISHGTTIKEESPPLDEQPQIVGEIQQDNELKQEQQDQEEQPLRGGILSKAQLRKTLGPKPTSNQPGNEDSHQETIYRDASGRKIDLKAEKAEAARKKREKEQKDAERMQWGQGLAQRDQREATKAMMEREKRKGFARHADDEDLNEEQRARELWNDPAAAFLKKTTAKGPRKPQYSGPPPPPNRFGIKPGYRWDGVDRSNGFEKMMFQKLNEKKRQGAESYSWSVDDM